MTQTHSYLLAALLTLAAGAPAVAADAASAAVDPSRPALTTRVGGSPSDAEFRAVIQHSGDEYRDKRTACRKLAAAERSGCLSEAKAALAKERADAKTAHEEAKRAERAAAKK